MTTFDVLNALLDVCLFIASVTLIWMFFLDYLDRRKRIPFMVIYHQGQRYKLVDIDEEGSGLFVWENNLECE